MENTSLGFCGISCCFAGGLLAITISGPVEQVQFFEGLLPASSLASATVAVHGLGFIACGRKVFEFDFLFRGAQVGQCDGETFVQERHFLKAPRDGVEFEGGGFKNFRVRPESHRCAGAFGGFAFDEFFRDGVGEVLQPVEAFAFDVGFHFGGQSVDHGDTHTM